MDLGLVPLRSEQFVVVVEIGGSCYKVLQVVLRDRQGGMFVTLPYFKYAQGLLGHSTIPANGEQSANVDLRIGGKTTSHRVKYSHHADGEAHFSQDGRVVTAIRKKSVPLPQVAGHLFTIQIEGVEDFKRCTPKDSKAPSVKRTVLKFNLAGSGPGGYKFVGNWYTRQQILANNPGPHRRAAHGPQVVLQSPWGKQTKGFLLAAPQPDLAEEQMLFLTCEEVPQLTHERKSYLLFMGGFDEEEVVLDTSKQTSALFLVYEDRGSSFDDLTQLIGSVDWWASQTHRDNRQAACSGRALL